MKKEKISNFKLFRILFFINLVTFGGGYTIIPIIKDEFVDKRNYISEDEMLKIVTVSQSLPGVMTVSASFLTGYRINGYIGAVVSVLASILPCFIIISLISLSYNKFIENELIKSSLNAISGAIIGLLLLTVISMLKKLFNDNKKYFYIFIIVLSFLARYFFKLDIVYIIIFSGLIGYFYNRGDK